MADRLRRLRGTGVGCAVVASRNPREVRRLARTVGAPVLVLPRGALAAGGPAIMAAATAADTAPVAARVLATEEAVVVAGFDPVPSGTSEPAHRLLRGQVDEAARRAAAAAKAAVLTSPDARPEDLGRELTRLGARHRRVIVGSHLGEDGEAVAETDLAGLAGGPWDPLSVVVLLDDATVPAAPVLAWGLPEGDFAHREGMITKAEVRAVALGKLALPAAGVLWDVGAGSGSVAVECALLRPGLRVVAVERDREQAERVRINARDHGAPVDVVEGQAPAVLAGLPDPDRAFVGGGGIDVLDAVMDRLAPGGRVVATYAALDRAATAAGRLGHMVQLGVSRAKVLPDGGIRLGAENPVFVAWGPDE